jgi:hypothetical protein
MTSMQIDSLEQSKSKIQEMIDQLKLRKDYLIANGDKTTYKTLEEKLLEDLNKLRSDTIGGFTAMGADVLG